MARFSLALAGRHDTAAKDSNILALAGALFFCGLFGSLLDTPAGGVIRETLLSLFGLG